MKYLLAILLCSCTTTTPFRATYVNFAPSADLMEDNDFNSRSGEVGFMYGGNEEATHDQATGLVRDFAVSALHSEGDVTTDIIPGVTARTDHVDIDLIGVRTGLRFYFNGVPSRLWQPYVGAALLSQYGTSNGENATAFGFSGIVGVDSQLTNHLRVGMGYQFTSGMDFEDVDMDSQALVFSLGVGF